MADKLDSKSLHHWRQMVDTFIWVEQQQHFNKSRWATAQWVLEQQMRHIYGSDVEDRRHKAAEKRRAEHLRCRADEEYPEVVLNEHNKRKRRVLLTWEEYETRWNDIHDSTQPLSYHDIPWPVRRQPSHAHHLSEHAIKAFLITDPDREQRRKRALLIWHPDRFNRLLSRVVDKDKDKVEESVGIVARVLTKKDFNL